MNNINKLTWWLLKKICEKVVIQSYNHDSNITKYISILVKEARKEFQEDNKIILDNFLQECFDKALEEE